MEQQETNMANGAKYGQWDQHGPTQQNHRVNRSLNGPTELHRGQQGPGPTGAYGVYRVLLDPSKQGKLNKKSHNTMGLSFHNERTLPIM